MFCHITSVQLNLLLILRPSFSLKKKKSMWPICFIFILYILVGSSKSTSLFLIEEVSLIFLEKITTELM